MDNVDKLYNEGKLLARAMDRCIPSRYGYYEGHSWANEFTFMMNDGLYSASSTLLIPGVGISVYKNIGFLVNSDLAHCFHISKTDSSSRGNYADGDFWAGEADFTKIEELAEFIKSTNAREMNEVNINLKLDAVVGLFACKCENFENVLRKIYVAKTLLKALTGIDYPIYAYDSQLGQLDLVTLSKEQEEELIAGLRCDKIMYWTDDSDEPLFVPIEASSYHI